MDEGEVVAEAGVEGEVVVEEEDVEGDEGEEEDEVEKHRASKMTWQMIVNTRCMTRKKKDKDMEMRAINWQCRHRRRRKTHQKWW